MDEEHDLALDEELDEELAEEEEPQQPRKTRGPTKRKAKNTSTWVWKFNHLNQPIGKKWLDYSTELGTITRNNISITNEDWRLVEPELKEKIWLELKEHYSIVDDTQKSAAIKQAGDKFKQFKTNLRKRFMDKGKSPCSFYTQIEPAEWEEFLIQENKPEKRAAREKGRDNAAKKVHPPRLGPLGYRGQRDKWAKEAENLDEVTPQHLWPADDRGKDYTLARLERNADGKKEVPPSLKHVVDQLGDYNQRLHDGTWVPPLGEDSLIVVLGNEHPGRTRVTGHLVGLKQAIPRYTKKPRKTKKEEIESIARRIRQELQEEYKQEMEEKLRESKAEQAALFDKMFQERLNETLMQMQLPVPVQVSAPETSPGVMSCESAPKVVDEFEKLKAPMKCVLFVPFIAKRKKCATGMVHPIGDGILHGKAIRSICIKVCVDNVEKEYYNLDLPFQPNDEIEKLKDALNTFIEWPRKAIGFLKPKVRAECGTKNSSKEIVDPLATLLSYKVLMEARPTWISNFYNFWMHRENPLSPHMVHVGPDVFLSKEEFHFGIQSDDVMLMLSNGWLDASIISFFVLSLHNQAAKRPARGNKCAFLNPFKIQDEACQNEPDSVRAYLCDAIAPNMTKKAVFILPYLIESHWTVVIIAPRQGLGFILDSRKRGKDESSYLITPLLHTAVGRRLKWTLADCNQQKDHWECGYYIMRWMQEFMTVQQNNFPETVPWNNLASYSQATIENIVGTWIGYFHV